MTPCLVHLLVFELCICLLIFFLFLFFRRFIFVLFVFFFLVFLICLFCFLRFFFSFFLLWRGFFWDYLSLFFLFFGWLLLEGVFFMEALLSKRFGCFWKLISIYPFIERWFFGVGGWKSGRTELEIWKVKFCGSSKFERLKFLRKTGIWKSLKKIR